MRTKDLEEINEKLTTITIISRININMYNRDEIKEDKGIYIKNLKEIAKLSIEINKKEDCCNVKDTD